MGVTHSLRRWPLRNVTIDGVSLLDHERRHMQNQKSSKQTLGHARVSKSTKHWHVLLRPQMSLNVKGLSEKSPLEKLPQKIVVSLQENAV